MKKLISIFLGLSLATVAFAQNTMDRPMEAFPTGKENHIMCQEAWQALKTNPAQAPQIVTEALQSGNRQYSNAVLGYADETAGAKAIVKAVKKVFPQLSDASRADVFYWIGRNKLTELQSLIDGSLAEGEAGEAAVFAATQIGGDHNKKLLDAHISAGGPLSKEIQRLRGLSADDNDDDVRNTLRDQK